MTDSIFSIILEAERMAITMEIIVGLKGEARTMAEREDTALK